MIIIDCEQGSPEWHAARCGVVTASRVADLMAKTKSGWSASRANYAAELIAERLTGSVADRYCSPEMQWGRDHEAEAARIYAFERGIELSPIGFVLHQNIPRSGCSPDRLADADGLIEIKCPNTATHIDTLLGAAIDGKYVKQMQWQMACTGRVWCDFVSFDPRLPVEMQLHVSRVARDAAVIASMEDAVREFIAEIDEREAKLRERYGMEDAA